jgi:hypothetical protein
MQRTKLIDLLLVFAADLDVLAAAAGNGGFVFF